MNTLGDIKKKYKLDTDYIAKLLGLKSASNIYMKYVIPINELTISQLIELSNETKAPYNELLGEQVFTTDNINIQIDNTKHTSLSDSLVTIDGNDIHLHPSFIKAIRDAIRDNK